MDPKGVSDVLVGELLKIDTLLSVVADICLIDSYFVMVKISLFH